MERRHVAGFVALSLGMILSGTPGVSESQPPAEGPAVGETPAWFLQGSFPDPTGRAIADPSGHVTVPPRSGGGGRGAGGGTPVAPPPAPGVGGGPGCRGAAPCGHPARP